MASTYLANLRRATVHIRRPRTPGPRTVAEALSWPRDRDDRYKRQRHFDAHARSVAEDAASQWVSERMPSGGVG